MRREDFHSYLASAAGPLDATLERITFGSDCVVNGRQFRAGETLSMDPKQREVEMGHGAPKPIELLVSCAPTSPYATSMPRVSVYLRPLQESQPKQ